MFACELLSLLKLWLLSQEREFGLHFFFLSKKTHHQGQNNLTKDQAEYFLIMAIHGGISSTDLLKSEKNMFSFQVFKHLLSPYYVHSTGLSPVRDTQINKLWFLKILSLEWENGWMPH